MKKTRLSYLKITAILVETFSKKVRKLMRLASFTIILLVLVSCGKLGYQTSQEPVDVVKGFIEDLGRKNYQAAFEKTDEISLGRLEIFKSDHSFGSITSTEIHSVSPKPDEKDTAVVFADASFTSAKGTKRLLQLFYLLKFGGNWKIIGIKVTTETGQMKNSEGTVFKKEIIEKEINNFLLDRNEIEKEDELAYFYDDLNEVGNPEIFVCNTTISGNGWGRWFVFFTNPLRMVLKMDGEVHYKLAPSSTNGFRDIIGLFKEDQSVYRFNGTDYTQGSGENYQVIDGIKYGSLEYNGFTYKTVVIGNQEWTVENLRTTKYNDGTSITKITDSNRWKNTSSDGFCAYDNDEINVATYGYLYKWYTVNTGKLAPASGGWRVPTDADWTKLTGYVGGASVAGEKLKKQDGWNGRNGSNYYGFSALPNGHRHYLEGEFNSIGNGGYWWSSSAKGASDAWYRDMGYDRNSVGRNSGDQSHGFSVRLVRDL
ncbi:MAG: fibrobacter succinogenes major paralogous domain-containing protein [Bacteroidetes bacterium]|nr:fibrobacter succinogenes major paralogous domain-containing protein [Bacteroidota bacterium]